jgi:ribonucleoside-diphosphate reductase alpha chain
MTLDELKNADQAPAWMTTEGFETISRGYLLSGETPRGMYERVANAADKYIPGLKDKVFEYMWKGWLCGATPVLSNMGTDRGLPISCNSISVPDSVSGIFAKNTELAMLSKHGAGVGIYVGRIRGRGTTIKGNGKSEGVIPWCKVYDTTTQVVSQGSSRRGASVVYLPVDHPDIEEFLELRKPTGDANRRCLNLNHGVCITNAWMEAMLAGDKAKREIWQKVLYQRVTTGEPYLFFTDNVNDANPECYKANGLHVETSNLCSEIKLFTDPDHTFVCCLSSLNVTKYNEWKDTDLVEVSVKFLDAVLSEYIEKASKIPGFEASVRSAVKGRALGLGVLGWHTYLQELNIPFDSFEAMRLNAEIFRTIRTKADNATKELAEEFGEPEWCKGFGRRNTHTTAVAPTVSNSAIAGGHSAGIEPIAANVIVIKSAKGTFIRKNVTLEKVLEKLGKNDAETWRSISSNSGSVQHLSFLDDETKQVFLTAREINQHTIVNQAAQRQRWIDQGQSVNLFFASNSDPKYIHEVHVNAWKSGMKSLYYCRSEGVLKADMASRTTECKACEG